MEVPLKLLVVTFESLSKILWYYHSKETSSLNQRYHLFIGFL